MKNNKENENQKKHKKLKFFFKQAGVFLGCLALASGTTFGIIYANRGGTTYVGAEEEEDKPLTPAQKLLESVMDLKVFSIDADVEFADMNSGNSGTLAVNGYADVSDYGDIQITGDLDVEYGYTGIEGKLGYFDNTIFVDYNDSKLKMATEDITGGVDVTGILDVMQGAGINVDLPEELTNLNVETIMEDLGNMEPMRSSAGNEYIFELPLGDDKENPLVTVYFVSDDQYNFSKLYTNRFYFNDVRTYLEVDVNEITDGSVDLSTFKPDATKYSNFRPAFNFISGITEFFGDKSNSVNMELTLKKDSGTTDWLSMNMDLAYDLENNQYATSTTIYETAFRKTTEYGEITSTLQENDPALQDKSKIKEERVDRTHSFKAYFLDKTLYFDNAGSKISINAGTINLAMNLILDSIDEDKLNGLIEELMSGMGDVDLTSMSDILANIMSLNNWITAIEVVEGTGTTPDRTAITIDLSGLLPEDTSSETTTEGTAETESTSTLSAIKDAFKDIPAITIYGNSSLTEFVGFGIDEFTYGGYSASFYLTKGTYEMVTPVDTEFVKIDNVVALVPGILALTDDTRFRMELSGSVDTPASKSEDGTVSEAKSMGITGGFQFDINNVWGYGDITITDYSGYKHKIAADYGQTKTTVINDDGTPSEETGSNILVSYNDTMKAKMANPGDMDYLMETVKDIAVTRDEHFYELFGDIVRAIAKTPIYYAIANQEFGLIFATEIFSNIQFIDTDVETGIVQFDVSGALVGLEDCTITIGIEFDEDGIKGILADNIKFGSTTMSFDMDLVSYNESLDSSRLQISAFSDAMEISDLTTLLRFGINTSQYDGYRFQSETAASVSFLGLYTLDIPLDIKVDNYKGNVSIAVEMSDIPIIDIEAFGIEAFDLNGIDGYDGVDGRSASIYYQDGKVYMKRVDKVYNTETIKPNRFWPAGWYYQDTHYDIVYECVDDTAGFMDNIMSYLLEFILGITNDTVLNAVKESEGSSDSESTHQIEYEKIVNTIDYNEDGGYFNFDISLEALTGSSELKSFVVKAGVDKEKEELESLEVLLDVTLGVTGLISIDVSASLPLTETYHNSYKEGGECLDMSAMTSYIESAKDHKLGEKITNDPKVTKVVNRSLI